jgi:UDP-3-O-[3-hydroxymyristoyl] glucosamine N-acyltransferase
MKLFYSLHEKICSETDVYWKSFSNNIHPTAKISPNAHIANKNIKIGANTIIDMGVVIKEKTIIGDNCYIGCNSVISSDGYEYKKFDNEFIHIRHGSGVVIGNNVNINSLCAIDNGLYFDSTSIGDGSKLDNCVHVGHGVQIGKNCLITASCMFAAAVIVKDGTRVDPNASLAHELILHENSYVSMGAVVTRDVEKNTKVTGNFALPHAQFIENLRFLKQKN